MNLLPKSETQKGRVYGISFSTNDTDKTGYVRAVKVMIFEDIVGLDEQIHINLVDDPLYRHLLDYMKANAK